jgi:hypothetical protein
MYLILATLTSDLSKAKEKYNASYRRIRICCIDRQGADARLSCIPAKYLIFSPFISQKFRRKVTN